MGFLDVHLYGKGGLYVDCGMLKDDDCWCCSVIFWIQFASQSVLVEDDKGGCLWNAGG